MQTQNAFQLFLTQKRFDLIFKWLYLQDAKNPFIQSAYLENIRAFNGFKEENPSDGKNKEGAAAFLQAFNDLFASIKQNGFSPQKGIIPLGENGEINDGAHRLMCCASLNKDIILETNQINDLYDFLFFKERGMAPNIMDYGALEYVKLNPNAYIVNLHAIADKDQDSEVYKILNKYGFVFYQKDISLSFNGYVNLKKLSYGAFWERASWIGNANNAFKGAQDHALASMGPNPLRVFVFVCDDINKVIKAKTEIRNIFKQGNYSIHINDSHTEAVWLAETYFNENSLHMLNNRPFAFEDVQFDSLIEELYTKIHTHNIPIENICGAGSTPLNVYGVRHSQDLDFLCSSTTKFDIQTDTLSNHDSQLEFYPYSKTEIITNPKYHFYYHGMKFISLDVLYNMKKKRNEHPKDVYDCRLIKKIQKNRHPFKFFNKQKQGNIRIITLFGCLKFSYHKKDGK